MQADEPLGTFMDYCTYGHMIDNVVLLVTGTLHERDVTVSTHIHACYVHRIVQCCPLLVNGSSHCLACLLQFPCIVLLWQEGPFASRKFTHANAL
jgi:hypothetical protein